MTDILNKVSPFGVSLVRFGMSAVFIMFGFWQLVGPDLWTAFVPPYAANLVGGNTIMLVLLNGWFELIAGLMLLVGLQVRTVSLLLGVHLALISQSLGFSQLGVRDIGLSVATLSIFLSGHDPLSLDRLFANQRNMKISPADQEDDNIPRYNSISRRF
ncbi:MAG: DoxX family membrane protein [Patescibacteria group bacterium]|nr:DoxX family membrane protein [Patescibacteria group bacterium]